MLSDVRLKMDIVPIGVLENGISVYSFRYLGAQQYHTGVMAQEVQEIIPSAVTCGDDGYLRVDYSQIGWPA